MVTKQKTPAVGILWKPDLQIETVLIMGGRKRDVGTVYNPTR